jgi:hypothetical protein
MPELETTSQATKPEDPTTCLLVAIPSPIGVEILSPTIGKLTAACRTLSTPCQATLAIPGDSANGQAETVADVGISSSALRVVRYPTPAVEPGLIPWLANATAYPAISGLAMQMGARACTVLGTGLGNDRESLTAERLALLLDPAIDGSFDLVMPLYATQAFDDLVNKSILYPLTRVLYGHRVHNPLGNEFQMSARLFSALAAEAPRNAAHQQGRLPWLGTLAATRNLKICQARLGQRRPSRPDGIELSDALEQLAGPLFLDMEDNAAFWQRVRGSHEAPAFGLPEAPPEGTDTVDVRHMVEAFQLGVRSLRDVWSSILPPLTLLELHKIARLAPDAFHMEDNLWARIVYDFALAHRLRNIRRTHLFGALTPLYLGWVASYAVDVNKKGIAAAGEKIEQLARAFETEKPYLVSRWRWPDRFHP